MHLSNSTQKVIGCHSPGANYCANRIWAKQRYNHIIRAWYYLPGGVSPKQLAWVHSENRDFFFILAAAQLSKGQFSERTSQHPKRYTSVVMSCQQFYWHMLSVDTFNSSAEAFRQTLTDLTDFKRTNYLRLCSLCCEYYVLRIEYICQWIIGSGGVD